MGKAKTVIAAVLASVSLAHPSRSAQAEEEIIGWYWACGIQFSNELGQFNGRRVLTDSGDIKAEDSASWTQLNYGLNSLSLGIQWDNSNEPQRLLNASIRPLESLPGAISFSHTAQPSVTKRAILRFRRIKGFYKETGLTISFDRGAAKYLTINSMLLEDLLAFGHDRDALFWTIEDLKPKYLAMPVVKEGILDMNQIRGAQLALVQVDGALDAAQADYRTKCSRYPEYDNPLAEI